jgi:hypothetical protein
VLVRVRVSFVPWDGSGSGRGWQVATDFSLCGVKWVHVFSDGGNLSQVVMQTASGSDAATHDGF